MSAVVQEIVPYSQFEQLREARSILRQEADAVLEVSKRLDAAFCAAVDLIAQSQGSVIVSGMGKAGLIGRKIAATLSSLGTRAHFLHPAEAVHGDLGCVHPQDILLALSNSGETEELTELVPLIRRIGAPIVAITGSDRNTLASQADLTIQLGRLREAGPWGLAPSCSTTAMLAVGDALALVVSRVKGFTPQQFAVFHPAGAIGRQLKSVTDLMRPFDQLRIALSSTIVRDVFVAASKPGRRTGAVLLVDDEGRLEGLFTDSDLARLLEQRRDGDFDVPISEVMTRDPLTVRGDASLADVVVLLSERKISELPVVDEVGHPLGLMDITDIIGWLPAELATK